MMGDCLMTNDRNILTVRLCMCLITVLITLIIGIASVMMITGNMDPIFDDAERDGLIGLLILCMFLKWVEGVYEKMTATVKSSDSGTETGIETN